MEKRELSKAEWLDKAEAYCARAEHCAADVRRKLYEWQAPADLADEIEEKLRERDFINDLRFCKAYVHDKVEYQHWGRVKIRAGLQALHLSTSAIEEAMETIDEERYREMMRALVAHRKGESEDKTGRFLLQRGFTYEEIQKLFAYMQKK